LNIYDFDKTIYDGDSTVDFIKYCGKHYKKAYVTAIPTLWAFLLYMLGIYTKTQFKERMYRFLRYVDDIDSAVSDFWNSHEKNILDYYKKQHREDDIIISASPEFLLRPICNRLGIKYLIASRVDKHTGIYTGENCYGEEKVLRLEQQLDLKKCDNFYSDSFSDTPLAEISKNAYIVRRNTLTPWDEYESTFGEKFKHMFLNPEFFMFLVVGVINTLSNVIFSTIYSLFIPNTTVAFLPGYVTSNIVSYLLNSKLTFKENLGFVKFIKFFISYIPNFIIQTVIVWLFDTFIHGPSIIAYALAAVIGVPVTFVIMKIFAFRKKSES
jgi:HAD superfamily phosphoserine phosphatase-like hydrolase